MKKKLLILIPIILILIIMIIFLKNNYKKISVGNNIDKSTQSVIDDILNISSYEAKMEITVNSNKNTNQYEITQLYNAPNLSKQMISKPDDLSGLTMKYDGDHLTIENTNLSMTKVYENYQYLNNNDLWLSNFIEDYKIKQNSNVSETEEEIKLEIKELDNLYSSKRILYINKKTGKPIKLEVIDNNKKTRVYIIYKEIELNSTNKDEVLAFKSEKNKIEL